jgi:hypothetical protein
MTIVVAQGKMIHIRRHPTDSHDPFPKGPEPDLAHTALGIWARSRWRIPRRDLSQIRLTKSGPTQIWAIPLVIWTRSGAHTPRDLSQIWWICARSPTPLGIWMERNMITKWSQPCGPQMESNMSPKWNQTRALNVATHVPQKGARNVQKLNETWSQDWAKHEPIMHPNMFPRWGPTRDENVVNMHPSGSQTWSERLRLQIWRLKASDLKA